MKHSKRLTPKFDNVGTNDLHDFMSVMCANMETALLQNGANPDCDYTHLDLMKLAAPFALERFKSKSSLRVNVWDKDSGLFKAVPLVGP